MTRAPTTPGLMPLALLTLMTLAACGPSADSATPHDEVREASTDGGSWRVSYAPTPDPIPPNDFFSLMVAVSYAEGAAVQGLSIVVDATMPSHGHGMNTAPLVEDRGDGSFFVDGMLFHMTGDWVLTVDVTDGAVTERASFPIDCCVY